LGEVLSVTEQEQHALVGGELVQRLPCGGVGDELLDATVLGAGLGHGTLGQLARPEARAALEHSERLVAGDLQ
jgi:hypothetical protein